MLRRKQPNTVTRFIGYHRHYNKQNNVVYASAFINDKNKRYGEISVYDIDEELQNNNVDKIFSIGDKIYSNPPTPARADLLVSEIEKIKLDNENLFVETSLLPISKHCNIKPFPSDDSKAIAVALELAKISTLHLRRI